MIGERRLSVIIMLIVATATVSLVSCSVGSESLRVGQGIPFIAPSATATGTAVPTQTATATREPTVTATQTATPTSTITPTPTQTAEPLQMEVAIRPLVLVQGEVGEIVARTNRPCRAAAIIGEVAMDLQSDDSLTHLLLFGIDPMAAPGTMTLQVSAAARDGQAVTFVSQIEVVDGRYGSETIMFTPQISKLLDAEIIEPELERLAEVFGASSSDRQWQGLWSWPFVGPITSEFGTRRDYGGVLDSYHSGIDIDGITGDVVHASASGTVALAESLDVRGNAVIIDHGAGVFSGYFHLDRIDVASGDSVSQGDALGVMGSTGLSTGSHLHWEVRVHGTAVNPRQWTEQAFPASGMEVSAE